MTSRDACWTTDLHRPSEFTACPLASLCFATLCCLYRRTLPNRTFSILMSLTVPSGLGLAEPWARLTPLKPIYTGLVETILPAGVTSKWLPTAAFRRSASIFPFGSPPSVAVRFHSTCPARITSTTTSVVSSLLMRASLSVALSFAAAWTAASGIVSVSRFFSSTLETVTPEPDKPADANPGIIFRQPSPASF